MHPIQETGKRPTAALDRNLAYLGMVEVLQGYPLDGVVLTIGCDKTTPACLMAAATVNLPAIALSVGPMLNGWHEGRRTGSGTIIWKARELYAAGEIDEAGFVDLVASAAPSVGYCSTMGTATTMNSLAEALGMQLPGSAAIPAPYRERGQMAYRTGLRIVEMVREDLRPSDIMTREAFENAVVVNSAIGGSTNAPIHLNAIAAHLGVALDNDDWQKHGLAVPLLVNLMPAGEYLGEDFHHAGGVPAVVGELMRGGLLPHPDALTANGSTIAENCEAARIADPEVIRTVGEPLMADAGFVHLSGNLFDSAIMKTSVISEEFRRRYLSDPRRPRRVRGPRHRVRRARGLPGPHRGPRPRHRRALHAHRARGRPGGLSRARPRRSTCSPRPRCWCGECTRCRAWATAASRAPPARPRSSTPPPRPRPAAGSRCCEPATGSASTCDAAAPTCSSTTPRSSAAEPNSKPRAATRCRSRTPRGRRSSGRWSPRWTRAWFCGPR